MKRIPALFQALLLAELAAGLLVCLAMFPPAARTTVSLPKAQDAPAAPAKPAAALVLCYHTVAKRAFSPYTVSLSDFAAQMDWLAQRGYRVVPLSVIAGSLAARSALPDSLVAITFDDGYESVYSCAWPVLKKHGFPFALFIYPGFIGKGHGSLDWGQAVEMAAAGVEIGSHSMSHPVLTRRQGRPDGVYQRWLAQELRGSRDSIAARLGRPARYLAYPFGAFDRMIEDAAKAAGYEACLLVNAGVNDTTTSPYHIDRVIVSRRFSLSRFKSVFDKRSLELAGVTPYQGEEVGAARNLDISARIRNLEGIDPASITMKVTRSKGTAVIDTVTGLARFVLDKPLRKGFHEAVISARNRSGQRCVGCWMFLVRE
jgi:peptidoglycan/xylan/chitin deacetylase (PgdA/CDA1 family)